MLNTPLIFFNTKTYCRIQRALAIEFYQITRGNKAMDSAKLENKSYSMGKRKPYLNLRAQPSIIVIFGLNNLTYVNTFYLFYLQRTCGDYIKRQQLLINRYKNTSKINLTRLFKCIKTWSYLHSNLYLIVIQ